MVLHLDEALLFSVCFAQLFVCIVKILWANSGKLFVPVARAASHGLGAEPNQPSKPTSPNTQLRRRHANNTRWIHPTPQPINDEEESHTSQHFTDGSVRTGLNGMAVWCFVLTISYAILVAKSCGLASANMFEYDPILDKHWFWAWLSYDSLTFTACLLWIVSNAARAFAAVSLSSFTPHITRTNSAIALLACFIFFRRSLFSLGFLSHALCYGTVGLCSLWPHSSVANAPMQSATFACTGLLGTIGGTILILNTPLDARLEKYVGADAFGHTALFVAHTLDFVHIHQLQALLKELELSKLCP